VAPRRGTSKRKEDRKPRGGPPWVLLFTLFGVVVLLGAAAVCTWVFWGRDATSSPAWMLSEEMRYAPDEVSTLESRRLEQILANPDYQKLRAEFSLLRDVERDGMVNVPASEVERVTVAHGGGGSVSILRMKKSVTADDVKRWDGRGAWMPPEKVRGYVIHSVLQGPVEADHDSSSFCVPSSKVVLLGGARSLRKVLKRNGGATMNPQMERGLKMVDLDKHLVKVVGYQEPGGASLGNDNPLSPGTLTHTKGRVVVLKTCQTQFGATVDSTVVFVCTDAEAAQALKPAISDNTTKEGAQYGKTRAALYANQTVTVDGSTVTVRDSHSMDALIAWLREINKR